MRQSANFRLLLILGILLAILTGCSRDPNVRKRKYLESGQRYFEKAKYREAAIQFTNAIQVDPQYAEAHYQLGQTYLRLQQWLRAYQELQRTVELQPDHYEAHKQLANLLIAGREFTQAKEHTDFLLQKQPNDPEVHATMANLLAAQGNFNGAIGEMQKAISLRPDRAESYVSLAILQDRSGQTDAAEANFKKVVELDPKAVRAEMALGAFYQSHSRFAEAEQEFRKAIAVDPKLPDSRAALARLYLMEGKRAEAEEFLKQSKPDVAENPTGYRMLGDFYFATGDVDQAIKEYASLYKEHPKDLQVKKNYIQLLILKDRLEEAQKLNDEVLKTNANEGDALVYRAQIEIRQNHARDAIQTLQTALKNDPQNAVAHYHLGMAFDQTGDLSRSENEWQTAVNIRPDLIDAQRALASVAVRKHDMAGLEQAATQIISIQPASPDGYALRAVSFINRQQFNKAQQDVQKAIDVAPNSPIGFLQQGNLAFAQKKYADAQKSFRIALDRQPSSADALAGLMNCFLAQKQPDEAIAAANAQIAKVPDSSAFYNLLGTTLFNNKKDLNGAEVALKKSSDLDKNNADALLKLGQVQIAKGATDQAIATYQNSLKNNPNDASFCILLGELYESKRDWNSAKEMYQKALVLKPENPLASNNLAYVMLQTGDNADMALSLAQTARRGMPDSPNAADTLGWVYYQKGAYRSAIDLFQEAIRLKQKAGSADDPTYHYHLGLAYQKTDQTALARQHLERVLKINPNYSDASDVKKLLAQLQ